MEGKRGRGTDGQADIQTERERERGEVFLIYSEIKEHIK